MGRTGDKDSIWGIQGKLMNLKYYPGNTYKYKCTITSDKDKRIFVKVADDAEDALGRGYIHLKKQMNHIIMKQMLIFLRILMGQ